MRKEKLFDLAAVAVFVGLAAVLSLALKADTILSVLLYLGVPAVFLCLRSSKNYPKLVLSSVVMGLLLGMVYDFAAELNNVWIVHYNNPVLNFHIVGKTPIGDFVWAFLIPFSILVFYEHFLDDEKRPRLSSRYPEAIFAGVILFISAWLLMLFHPYVEPIPYAYSVIGIISLLPLLGLFFARRTVVRKLFIMGLFFFVLNLTFEITALLLHQWNFPGQYIAWVTIYGISFPLEELMLWIIPSSLVFVYCYEMFFDDGR